MMKLYLNDCGIVCALGRSLDEVRRRLLDERRSGIVAADACSPGRSLPLGQVLGPLPVMDHLPLSLHSRNNQLALLALEQIRPQVDAAIARFGADRIGVVIGTSTSGVANSEHALGAYFRNGVLPDDFHYAQQEMGSSAELLAHQLGIGGPAYVHSSACASSAKAMASAARLIRMGLCDVVLTGGVDSLCAFTVAGFGALESVSAAVCNPLSLNRKGINIGEGAALFLMSATPATVALCGWGESSDGYHMSAPDPGGDGARLAIMQALQRAAIDPFEIDYINLHGTATIQNDAMESKLMADMFGLQIPVSSTKPFTGHALGAAAAIEAALCWIAMQDENAEGELPVHLWDGVSDPLLPALRVVEAGMRLGRPLRYVLSNSFAFGGANAALIFGRTP